MSYLLSKFNTSFGGLRAASASNPIEVSGPFFVERYSFTQGQTRLPVSSMSQIYQGLNLCATVCFPHKPSPEPSTQLSMFTCPSFPSREQ